MSENYTFIKKANLHINNTEEWLRTSNMSNMQALKDSDQIQKDQKTLKYIDYIFNDHSSIKHTMLEN